MRYDSYEVKLKNMAFFLHFGFHKADEELGQRLFFDLNFHLDTKAYKCNNDISSVYDYSKVGSKLEQVAKMKNFRLLEDLASHIATHFLKEKTLQKLDISIRKPSAPIDTILDYVEINMSFLND